MKCDFEREEQNMLILRHPYLTIEQSYGHVQKNRAQEFCKTKIDQNRERFEKKITIADHLAHMRVTEAWD